MSAAPAAVLLLLLGLTGASPAPPNCDEVIKPLRRDQVDKALGSWVLVGSVSDEEAGLLGNVSTSFMELSLSEDNSSIIYRERNKVSNYCVWINSVANVTEDTNLTIQIDSMVTETRGVVTSTQDVEGRLTLFQDPHSPEDHLIAIYTGNSNPCILNVSSISFTLNYRREGLHQDPVVLEQVALNTRRQADCLHMAGSTAQFTYDGVSEPCPSKLLSVEAEDH